MDDDMINSIFPNGLHILLVDDDVTFLGLLEMMLSSCQYKVTACNSPISALSILLDQPDKFDLLLTDLEMPEMDGYELLKIVKKKLGIPVIMMSVDARAEVTMKGIQEGACYFLHKPISINLVRNLWIHVVWKKFSDDKEIKKLRREREKGKAPLVFDSRAPDYRAANKKITIDGGSSKAKMKQILEQEDDPEVPKRRRVLWTYKLNKKFEDVIAELGIEQAIPSKIAQLMNVEGIDRHHVGSHLQKYRMRLRQEKEKQQSHFSQNRFHCTMNPSYQGGYMGMRPKNIRVPSPNPVLVPQAATYPTWVNVPGTGNAILGSFSGSVRPQQVGGCSQQYYNTNCFPTTAFGATDVGINARTFSSNPDQNIVEENTVSVTEFASFNNNFQAPGTSTPDCHAAGGLAPSGLLMDSNLPLRINMGQENPSADEAATSSRPMEDCDIEKIIEEFLEEGDW